MGVDAGVGHNCSNSNMFYTKTIRQLACNITFYLVTGIFTCIKGLQIPCGGGVLFAAAHEKSTKIFFAQKFLPILSSLEHGTF
jgi:hypothetical protein